MGALGLGALIRGVRMVIAQPTPEEPRPRLGLVRLRFGSDLDPAFREYHFHQSLVFMRLALVLGAVLYALFGVLDLFIVPDAARSI